MKASEARSIAEEARDSIKDSVGYMDDLRGVHESIETESEIGNFSVYYECSNFNVAKVLADTLREQGFNVRLYYCTLWASW